MIRAWINPGAPAVGPTLVQLADRRLPGDDLGEEALVGAQSAPAGPLAPNGTWLGVRTALVISRG